MFILDVSTSNIGSIQEQKRERNVWIESKNFESIDEHLDEGWANCQKISGKSDGRNECFGRDPRGPINTIILFKLHFTQNIGKRSSINVHFSVGKLPVISSNDDTFVFTTCDWLHAIDDVIR